MDVIALSSSAQGCNMNEETENAEPVLEQEQPQVESNEAQEQPKVDSQAENWRKANEILSLQKREIEELRQRLEELPKQKVQEEPDEFSTMDPEDYLTVGKARQLAEKLAGKKAEQMARQVVQEYAQQQTIANDEIKARGKYEDYDYVVENYAIPLIKSDPALAHKIQMSKNPAETAYKLGKLSDAYEETNMKNQTSPRAEKILKNTSRPVSSAAAGTPLKSQADQYSKMSPSEVWQQSQKWAKGA